MRLTCIRRFKLGHTSLPTALLTSNSVLDHQTDDSVLTQKSTKVNDSLNLENCLFYTFAEQTCINDLFKI